jgi:T-complex protein 1 subunit epsilon
MSLAFDEFGRPFIIIREQEKKKRTKGMEAHKVSYRDTISYKSEFLPL